MPVGEWHTRSFLIELKPRAEFASLFVDCPPTNESYADGGTSESDRLANGTRSTELVKVGEHTIELNDIENRNVETSVLRSRFYARIADLRLHPNTVCALTWADHRRLFMCKIRTEADGLPLVPKTFHRLGKDICSAVLLDEYAENGCSSPISLECNQCSLMIFRCDAGRVELSSMPEDDWLDTSPSMEYFCHDACMHSHLHAPRHSDLSTDSSAEHWMPTRNRIIVAHSFTLLLKEILQSDVVRIDDSTGIIKCVQCAAELGIVYRRNTNILQFHHSVTTLKASNSLEPYIDVRFGCMERYFAWLLLSQCESQTSLKLVIRSYDKRPYLLIWLLESYVVLTSGDLCDRMHVNSNGNDEGDSVHSFPALKMLYKVFDAESAKSDPRANGEDASVGLVDVPLGCCIGLIEVLLSSSHALPPACRAVGQFYVGFMKLRDGLEEI